jgi:surface antigen
MACDTARAAVRAEAARGALEGAQARAAQLQADRTHAASALPDCRTAAQSALAGLNAAVPTLMQVRITACVVCASIVACLRTGDKRPMWHTLCSAFTSSPLKQPATPQAASHDLAWESSSVDSTSSSRRSQANC